MLIMNDEKIIVLEKSILDISNMICRAKKMAEDSQKEANYHIGKMESRYDTFKEEAQYLAAASQKQVFDLSLSLEKINKLIIKIKNNKLEEGVSLGKCFEIKKNNIHKNFFVVPFVTITKHFFKNKEFTLISENAPIYHMFKNLQIGDVCEEQQFYDFEVINIF